MSQWQVRALLDDLLGMSASTGKAWKTERAAAVMPSTAANSTPD